MNYQDIDDIVTAFDPDLSAAEAHGLACGMICVNNRVQSAAWLAELFSQTGLPDTNDKTALEELFRTTGKLLVNQDFEYYLLLPSDETPLPERLEALRQWCQGFLFGLGTGNLTDKWPDDLREVIRDITELTKLDTDAEGEEAENDFMEIAEYIKTGVVFISAELNAQPGATIH